MFCRRCLVLEGLVCSAFLVFHCCGHGGSQPSRDWESAMGSVSFDVIAERMLWSTLQTECQWLLQLLIVQPVLSVQQPPPSCASRPSLAYALAAAYPRCRTSGRFRDRGHLRSTLDSFAARHLLPPALVVLGCHAPGKPRLPHWQWRAPDGSCQLLCKYITGQTVLPCAYRSSCSLLLSSFDLLGPLRSSPHLRRPDIQDDRSTMYALIQQVVG